MRIRLVVAALGLGVAVMLLNWVPLDAATLATQDVGGEPWWAGQIVSPLAGSLLPPLATLALVAATQRVLLSLFVGVVVAGLLFAGPWPHHAVGSVAAHYLWGSLADPFHLAVIVFTSALMGLVAVATRSGGVHGVVELVLRVAKGRRGTQVATGLMGLAVFFDDYANTAVIGPTMRPLFDRLSISREKLAYLIDATAAPVAGLAVVSTWIGTEVGYLQEAARSVGLTTSGYTLFFQAVGFRFYCIFALALVFLIAASGRDFGSMRRAEARAAATGEVVRRGSRPLASTDVTPKEGAPTRWVNAVAPIGVVLVFIIAAVWILGAPQDPGVGGIASVAGWREAFIAASNLAGGNALSYVFAVAAITGSLVAIGMASSQGILTPAEGTLAWFAGARSIKLALGILILAWSLSQGCRDLHTAAYVAAALAGKVAPELLPLAVFGLAGVIAFATGTSWGTMAIVIPVAAPVAYQTGGEMTMVVAMAAVLDGAIFGDHCSPISDTTVLSSICSGCDHLDHVRTQIPYGLLGAAVAGGCGYLLVAGFGAPLWAGYLTGFATLSLTVRLAGRRTF